MAVSPTNEKGRRGIRGGLFVDRHVEWLSRLLVFDDYG
jgi:hypothetical protein